MLVLLISKLTRTWQKTQLHAKVPGRFKLSRTIAAEP